MKILITGVNGFIGGYLYREYVKEHEIIGIGKSSASRICSNYFRVDITSREDVNHFFQMNRDIDIIIHCAALAHNKGNDLSRQRYELVNNIGTRNLVDASKDYLRLKKFIFMSTISVYGERMDKSIYLEKDSCEPRSPYAITKKKAEEYIREAGLGEYYILRLTPVYAKDFMLNIERRTKIKGYCYRVGKGDCGLSLCNVKNVVSVCKHLLSNSIREDGEDNIYNISDSKTYTYSEILKSLYNGQAIIGIPRVFVSFARVLNILLKSQFIEENSVKLISSNIYPGDKISENIELTYDIHDLKED